jgi:hypothetical protein
MPFPAIQPVPGNKLMVLGSDETMFTFEDVAHYQCDIALNLLVAGESLELRFYLKRQQDSLFYQAGAPVTITGSAGGGQANGEKTYSFPFVAGHGVRVTGKQTGGTARLIDWCVYKV